MIMPLLTVTDVDASVAFYHDKLGFDLRMTMAPEGKNIFAIVNFGGSDIGLGVDNATPTPKPYAPGVQFMIYLPDDQNIDSYYADITAKGVKTDDAPTDTYWGDRTFSVHDLDGYWLTFAVTLKQIPVDQMEAAVRERDPQ